MVIDCHYHLNVGMLTIEEVIQKMDSCGIDQTVLMGKICNPFHEPGRVLVGMLQFLLTHRITRSIGRGFVTNFTPEGDLTIMGKVTRLYPDPENEPVFAAVKKYPGRFMGWVFVNPRGGKDPVKELERWKNEPGFAGVKAHPLWHQYRPVELAPVAEKLVATGRPLIAHVGFGEGGDYGSLLKEVPGLKLILCHAGFPGFSDTWKDIRDKKNIYVDLSQTTYVGKGIIKQAVEYLGPERCIYGTDGPFGFHGDDKKFDFSVIKDWIETLFPDSGIQRRILGENFQEIING